MAYEQAVEKLRKEVSKRNFNRFCVYMFPPEIISKLLEDKLIIVYDTYIPVFSVTNKFRYNLF